MASRQHVSQTQPHHAQNQFHPVQLIINRSHIAEMDYHLNQAPMSWPTRQNAVVFALRDLIPDCPSDVMVWTDQGIAKAKIGETVCVLGPEIGKWFDSAMAGLSVRPIRRMVWLPKTYLAEVAVS